MEDFLQDLWDVATTVTIYFFILLPAVVIFRVFVL